MQAQPETPPPAFTDGELLGRPGSAPMARPPSSMHPTPRRRQGKWLWLAPLLLLTAGIGGTLVFGVLTFTRAQADLKTAQSELEEEKAKREEAVTMLAGAKKSAGENVDEVERLKKELAAVKAEKKEVVKEVKKTTAKATAFEKKLRAALKKSEGDVKADGEKLTVNLVDKVLFSSGKADLTRQGKRVIKKLGALLKKDKDKQIFVQGHTDNIPIPKSNKKFSSNWELSAARAISVVQFLESEVKISGKRLGAVAFSKYRPIDRKRKSKNRRIEIVLLPKSIKFVGER